MNEITNLLKLAAQYDSALFPVSVHIVPTFGIDVEQRLYVYYYINGVLENENQRKFGGYLNDADVLRAIEWLKAEYEQHGGKGDADL